MDGMALNVPGAVQNLKVIHTNECLVGTSDLLLKNESKCQGNE